MKKALLIYNPISGLRIVPKKLDHILARFMEAGVVIQPIRLGSAGMTQLSELLEKERYSFIMASGGDGTICAAMNSMLKEGINLPFGIIPSGTCNDTARSLGIPSNLDKALDVILKGNTIEVDTGLINGETYFLNSCAGGTFAEVSYDTNDDMKKSIGAVAYYLKGLSEFTNVKPFHAKVTVDDRVIEEELVLFLILNGKHVAGLNNVISRANVQDGLMDIILVKKCYPLELAGLAINVLSDNLERERHAIQLQTRTCSIESDSHLFISVDGEKIGQLPITVSFLNKNLRVFAPAPSN